MADSVLVPKSNQEIDFKIWDTQHRPDSAWCGDGTSNGPQIKVSSSAVQLGGPEDVPLTHTAEELISGATVICKCVFKPPGDLTCAGGISPSLKINNNRL